MVDTTISTSIHEKILREKCAFWWTILAIPSAVVFLAGGLALYLPWQLLVLHTVLALSLLYFFLSHGMHFGVRYVSFTWDHPAQLTSNLGSFAFMVSASLYLFFLILPVTILTALFFCGESDWLGYGTEFSIATILFFLLFVRSILRFGAKSLQRAANVIG
jgi:hypothetical protein